MEKTKIKSQWKAQKRKEGLIEHSRLDIPVYDNGGAVAEHEENPDPTAPLDQRLHDAAGTLPLDHRPRDKGKEKQRHHRPARTQKIEHANDSHGPDSVRELMKEAYSKSNLHTFRADPLKTKGSISKGEKGRGQPNMKLRMNAMLAKIKQDLT